MMIHKRVALVGSILAVAAASPLAAAHGALRSGASTEPMASSTLEHMQANSSEAPAWHAGDGSLYDPNRVAAASPPVTSSTVAAAPPSTAALPDNTTSAVPPTTEAVPQSEAVPIDRVVPPSAASGRGTANIGRYSSTLK
jgi:hypothetical protein